MSREIYSEEQQFDQLFIWILIGVGMVPMIAILGAGIYKQIIMGQPWGDEPLSDLGLILVTVGVFVLLLGIIILFRYSKLEIKVDRWGVRYKFSPFIWNWKEILRHDIKSYKIRKYSFLRGYGVRWGLDGIKTLNVKGNMGIEFHYGENKKLLIGTQQPELFAQAIEKMMNPVTE